MGFRRFVIAGAAALVAAASAVAVQFHAEAAATPVYSAADVGFAEGSSTAGLAGRLDAMNAYTGNRQPFLRLDLNWQGVQPDPAKAPDFAALDPIVDGANARGMRVLLILAYSATWANGGKGITWFPTDDAAWRGLVDATVAHFGDKVVAYEVWNEPNLTKFGQYGDGSAEARRLRYWQLTKIAYERVHAKCSGCTVLAGASAAGDAVSETRNDNESAQWLDWAYANGYGTSFDAVTHHPYPAWNNGRSPSRPECATRWWAMFGPADEKCGELAAVRAVMVKRGDSAKKIWGTEFGYPSTGTGLNAAQTRDYLEEGIRNWRALDFTGPLFLFSYQDSPGCATATDPECNFGLTTTAGTPKQPAYDDVKKALTDAWQRTLAPGRSLHRQSALRSADGRFQLWLQGDGNLVLYQGSTVLWKVVNLKGTTLTNRTDGNLVLLNGAGSVVWSSGTAGKRQSDLNLQNDGNLVLYPLSTPLKASWSSGTWGHGI
jgi:polysaccharide biosynthesis protein PslG